MGCCFSSSADEDEREPLLQSNRDRAEESAETSPPPTIGFSNPSLADTQQTQRTGKFIVRNLEVPELDQRFREVAETFNKQQEDYENMKKTLQTLAYRYRTDGGLTQCLKKIQEEHEQHHITLGIKGYDFTLNVKPDDEIPDKLKRTQENIMELNKAAKSVYSVNTKLNEMIKWLLKSEETMTKEIEEAEPKHQDRIRLVDNLKDNLKETQRAKELNPKYWKEVKDLLNEVAELSGITP